MADLLPSAFDADDLRAPVSAGAVAVPAALARHTGTGTVFVHPDVLSGKQVWTAYWERSSGAPGEPAGILEEAPTWPEASLAVSWGRVRTSRVIVIDASGAAAWAGASQRPTEIDRDWSG
jgi:cytidine deaminase